MPWVISFIVSWVVFFLLVDWNKLKINILGGAVALALASLVDWGGQKLNLYRFTDLIIPWFGCSAFYKFGPILTIGILFPQYLPRGKWLQGINIIICSMLYLAMEILIIKAGVASYINWHILASFLFNILTLTSLTWFAEKFLGAGYSSRQ